MKGNGAKYRVMELDWRPYDQTKVEHLNVSGVEKHYLNKCTCYVHLLHQYVPILK